jgi:hypothetical protein
VTLQFSDRQRDRLLAVGVAVFAASYVAAARGIEDSMLSDAVGAGGVPQGVGIAMGVAAVALFIKSFMGRRAPAPVEAQPSSSHEDAAGLWRTAGLVLILVGYGLLLPLLGYPLTVSLLVLASGWLAGAAFKLPLGLCAALSGPLLWALFDQLLQVRMPVGSLWG